MNVQSASFFFVVLTVVVFFSAFCGVLATKKLIQKKENWVKVMAGISTILAAQIFLTWPLEEQINVFVFVGVTLWATIGSLGMVRVAFSSTSS